MELPGGRFAGAKNHVIEIFDLKSREVLFSLPAVHKWGIMCMCKCKEGSGNIIYTGSGDKTVKIWDINGRTCRATLTGHKGSVYCVLVHTSGYILSGSADHTVRVWGISKLLDKYTLQTIIQHGATVYHLLEVEEGRVISICGGSSRVGVLVWAQEEGKVSSLRDFPPPPLEGGFRCGLFIGKERVLLGGIKGNLFIFNTLNYLFQRVLGDGLHEGWISEIRSVGEDKYLTCSVDTTIKLVNIATQKVLRTLRGHRDYVYSILPILLDE